MSTVYQLDGAKQRVALAGYRLAELLNEIFK